MTKKELIEDILGRNIHHNISIDWSKMVDYDEDDNFDWNDIAGDMVDVFKTDFEDYTLTPINDCGNRNLGEGCELRGKIWTGGRSGATLYWDRYYNENGRIILQDYELEEMLSYELCKIKADLDEFDKMIEGLLTDFYPECQYQLDETRKEKAEAEKAEKKYQEIKKVVKEKGYLKRLFNDLIE